jgi:hypothetical protein
LVFAEEFHYETLARRKNQISTKYEAGPVRPQGRQVIRNVSLRSPLRTTAWDGFDVERNAGDLVRVVAGELYGPRAIAAAPQR